MSLTDIREQLLIAQQSKHTQTWRNVIGIAGKSAVTVEDFDFALNCTEQELRMIAVAAHVHLRTMSELSARTPEEGKNG